MAKFLGNLKKGALHRDLGVPMGKKIPISKLMAAKSSKDPVIARRATLAENMRHWKK